MTETKTSRSRIRDARGRLVRQLDPVGMHLLRPLTTGLLNRPETIPAQPLREIAEKIDNKWARFGYLIFMIYLVGLLLAYAGAIYFKLYISTSRAWDFVGVLFFFVEFVFLFGTFYLTYVIGKRSRFARAGWVMLEHRRCPHCGYDLRGSSPEAVDGPTVCPECGCAWIIDEPVIAARIAADTDARDGLQAKNKKLVIAAIAIGVFLFGIMFYRFVQTAADRRRRAAPQPTAPISSRATLCEQTTFRS